MCVVTLSQKPLSNAATSINGGNDGIDGIRHTSNRVVVNKKNSPASNLLKDDTPTLDTEMELTRSANSSPPSDEAVLSFTESSDSQDMLRGLSEAGGGFNEHQSSKHSIGCRPMMVVKSAFDDVGFSFFSVYYITCPDPGCGSTHDFGTDFVCSSRYDSVMIH